MKFEVENILIKEAIEIVSNAITSKNANPALTGLLIKCDENKAVLIGADGTNAIKKVLTEVETEENGDCLVSCVLLKSIISKFKYAKTCFKVEGNTLIVSNGKSVYKLNIIDSASYPNIEFKKLDNEIEISSTELKDVLNTTIIACADNNKKPVLMGVNFKMEENSLQIVSTDSYRLARVRKNFEDLNYNFNFTIPSGAIKMLLKISDKVESKNVSLLWNNGCNDILFKIKDVLFKTRMLDGAYPDISKIISSNYTHLIKINKQTLLETLDRICILSDNNALARHITLLTQDKDNDLILYGKDSGGNCTEGVEDYKLEDSNNTKIKLAFNAEYLAAALKTFNSERVIIRINGELRPMIISEDETMNKIQLILPVKVED